MKAIRLKVHQESANYRMPFRGDFRESYPLPPYSTVIGMIHKLADFREYHPMKVSVQGDYASSTMNLQTKYEFGGVAKGRETYIVNDLRVVKSIMHTQLLTNVNLLIHIVPENKDDFELIYQALKSPHEYPSLGRREDVANIKADITDLNQTELSDDLTIKNSCYVPFKSIKQLDLEDINGTYYKLEKDYQLVGSKTYQIRKWNTINAYYASNFTIEEDSLALLDDKNNVVFLA